METKKIEDLTICNDVYVDLFIIHMEGVQDHKPNSKVTVGSRSLTLPTLPSKQNKRVSFTEPLQEIIVIPKKKEFLENQWDSANLETEIDARIDARIDAMMNGLSGAKPEKEIDFIIDTKLNTMVSPKSGPKPKSQTTLDSKLEAEIDSIISARIEVRWKTKIEAKLVSKFISKPETKNSLNSLRSLKLAKKKVDLSVLEKDPMTTADYDPSKNISIKCFDDQRPKNKNYFPKTNNYGKNDNGLAVVMPFFNEHPRELEMTLHSLNDAWNYLRAGSKKWRDKPLYVCLIQDGWNRAHPEMKNYLKKLFPKKISIKVDNQTKKQSWWDHNEDFSADEEKQKKLPDKTYIFTKKNYGPVLMNPHKSFENDSKFMKISLIIKTKNRRKHNSHEWFLGENGFAESVGPKYLFLTDAFTMFLNTCLFHLVKAMDKDPTMIGATGRQRVMSVDQQGSSESIFSLQTMLRMVQLFDFESSNTMYNGAFSNAGFMPVVPGPCGLYLAENLLSKNVRDYYFETVNEEPDKSGIVLGNLRIAEDRVLTYAAVVKSPIKKAHIKFHPMAIFYFEAETDLKNFIFQRRRWINGSVAGYLYLLFFNFPHFLAWKTNWFRKLYVWILLMFQLLIYIMVSFAPSIQIKIFYYGLNYFLTYYGWATGFEIEIVGVIGWGLYLTHMVVHNNNNFNYLIMYTLLLFSAATSIISIASLLHYVFIFRGLTIMEALLEGGIVLYLGLYVLFGPFFVSILLSGKAHSTMLMIKSSVSFFLFLPMLIAWFGSYSYCRIWDLTWGNRPTSEIEPSNAEKKEKIMQNFKNINKKLIIAMAIVNICLYIVPLQGQLIIISIFFAMASYQLTLSIFYCCSQMFYKIYFIFKKIQINYAKGKLEQPEKLDKLTTTPALERSQSILIPDSYPTISNTYFV